MFCPRCGKEATPDAAFCSRCGAALPLEPLGPQWSEVAPGGTGDAGVAGGGPMAPGTPMIRDLGGPPMGGQAMGGPPASATALAETPPPSHGQGPMAQLAVRYGGFWRRFASFLLDAMMVSIASALLQVGMGVDFLDPDLSDPRAQLASAIGAVGHWLYCALFECSARQGTLGQQAMGIKVTDLQYRRISFARATGRHFAQILSAALLLFGYFMIAFTARKQGLHDQLAGCLVVRSD